MPGLYNHDAWTVAALFDGAGNVLQWNTLIAENTGFEEESIDQETTNSSYQSGTHQTMMLACSEYDGLQQLKDWKRIKTPLRAVALSKDRNGRNCRWTAPTKLMEGLDMMQGKRSDGDSYLKVILEEYDAEAWRYQNLIYNVPGSSIILPLAGPVLTLSAELGAAYTLTLTAKDYAGATVGSSTANIANGRGSVNLALPADTWTVEWDLDGANDGALRGDGGTEYIAG